MPGTAGKLQRIVWVVAGLLVLSLAWSAAFPAEEGGAAFTGCAVAADGRPFGTSVDGTDDPFRDPPSGGVPSSWFAGGRIGY